MERLLVTGIDSITGSNLALSLADRCEVLGLFEHAALSSAAVRTAPWQPDDTVSIESHVEAWQPQWIVHCGPLAASSWDPLPTAAQAAREPLVVERLAEAASRWGCRLTVVSSDVVFSGPRLFHEESSPASHSMAHAAHVRGMEQAALQAEALVVRTHAYGWSPNGDRPGFAEQACAALLQGGTCPADGRRHATPILASDLAELLLRAFETRLQGLYHLAGAERTSPHRFVNELAGAMGVALPAEACKAAPPATALPDETSLSSKCARRMLGMSTPLLREGLNRFVEQAHNGWRNAWQPIAAGEPRELDAIAA